MHGGETIKRHAQKQQQHNQQRNYEQNAKRNERVQPRLVGVEQGKHTNPSAYRVKATYMTMYKDASLMWDTRCCSLKWDLNSGCKCE